VCVSGASAHARVAVRARRPAASPRQGCGAAAGIALAAAGSHHHHDRRHSGRGCRQGRRPAPHGVALMCGIAGIFGLHRQQPVDVELVRRMNDSIMHRGPDGEGLRVVPGYVLAHRRMAIVGVKNGAQPMALPDEQLWVTFNGEIYNYLELRDELAATGVTFRTNSDTEVLLHGYRAWGTGLAQRLRGMFAFVIVDEARHELYAARDRVGKKPLYWCEHDEQFAFCSELKVLLHLP